MQNNEGAFERYKRRAEVLKSCDIKKAGYFIENSEQSTTVLVERTGCIIPVAMVVSFKEGADELFVFCYEDADFYALDYYTWTDRREVNHYYLASEEVTIIKDVGYRKLKSFECNVKVNNEFRAYFKGSLQAAKDTGFTSNFEDDRMLPVLICPLRENLNVGQYVDIDNQMWKVINCDSYSVKGLGFYTMSRAMNANDVNEMPEDESNAVYVGQLITIETYDGYYESSSAAIQLVDRQSRKVVVKVIGPSSNALAITKDADGHLIEHRYNAKENV